jgi:hypothetical protein
VKEIVNVSNPPLDLAKRVCSLEGRGDPFEAYHRLGAETKAALLRLTRGLRESTRLARELRKRSSRS